MNKSDLDLSLYLVTDSFFLRDRTLEWMVEEAVEGGVSIVQLREKETNTLDFFRKAESLKKVLEKYKVPLIINDRLDVALAVDADGLHLGQKDLPCDVARTILGENKILGISIETEEQLIVANSFDVDYIGISPLFSTQTKKDAAEAIGLQKAKDMVVKSIHKSVAIGGIKENNIIDVLSTGVDGICMVSEIMNSENPREIARRLKKAISKIKK